MLCATTLNSGSAADSRYPDWPCVQAKVPEISLVSVWDGGPIESAVLEWRDDQSIRDLVTRLAARRVPIDAAQKLILDFFAGATTKSKVGTDLFAGLFETLNSQRSEVMNGLERLHRSLKGLAEHIKTDTSLLRELQDKIPADESKISELGERIEWSTRIFEDRRKTIKYACEAPVIIERRLYALTRTIRQAMQ